MVFFHHFNPFSKQVYGNTLHNFFNEMYVGVTVFFVLSGFLIGYRYIDSKHFSFKNYLVNRIARIYPMYFLLTIFTFIVFYFSTDDHSLFSIKVFLLNITFLRGFFLDFVFTGISQGWSLTVEEMFYFSAPVLFILIRKHKYNLVLLPVLILLSGFVLVNIFSQKHISGLFDSNLFMLNYTFFGRCAEFFIGIALALFYKQNRERIKTTYATYTGVTVILICLFALSYLKGDFKYGVMDLYGILVNNLLLPFFGIAFLFWGLLTEKTFVQKILGSRLFVLLGKSSYIFYLIHLGVIEVFISNKITSHFVLIFILINIVSILLFKIIEEPLNKFIRRKLT